MVFILFRIGLWGSVAIAAQAIQKPAVDWWCDETECFYNDIILTEDPVCVSNNSIPYRLNYTSGTCELNLKALLLSFRVLSNRLGKLAEEKIRRRNEVIFNGIITSGKIFLGFAGVCAFMGSFYCFWVQYSYRQLRKSVKEAAKEVLARQKSKKPKQDIKCHENIVFGENCKPETMADVQVSIV